MRSELNSDVVMPRPRGRAARSGDAVPPPPACFHCGLPCAGDAVVAEGRSFCCRGCQTVHDLLSASGLGRFYELNRHPGIRVAGAADRDRWAYLDEPGLQERLLDFTDGRTSRVTFHVPAIHCIACVWLLENLFQLHPGIGRSQVNFPRRELSVSFATGQIKLSELVALLTSIGYEPALTFGDLEKPLPDPGRRRLQLQVGIAGFAFGNIMLVSLPQYLGLDSLSGPMFRAWFGGLSLALALPVLAWSAADYFRSAWLSFRRRTLTLDVPIALGLIALYGRSAFEILSGTGAGYLDSLTGLVFFLLCGKVFQRKAYDRLTFEADYKSFFPLSVIRKTPDGGKAVALSELSVGDRLLLRHGELLPADARLVAGPALIDYSFVTGEAEPVSKAPGDYLYAGGRQVGGAMDVEMVKPVSESYLTSLWNQEVFRKTPDEPLDTLTNRYGRWFTAVVVAIAVAAAVFWFPQDTGRALKAFTAVLIVACPCALALAAPFALGTAQRLLARRKVFLRNPHVLESLSRVDTVLFDKTGTLTTGRMDGVRFHGTELSQAERSWIGALTGQSIHPSAVGIGEALNAPPFPGPVDGFREIPGCGLAGRVGGHPIGLGSRSWLESEGVAIPPLDLPAGSSVLLAVDGRFRGAFVLSGAVRPGVERLVGELQSRYGLGLLSGDNDKERDRFRALLGPGVVLRFNQSPFDKLEFIRRLRREGRTVMMVGDGLNDAGALKGSQVGVAVVESMGAFSPASEVIVESAGLERLGRVLALARKAVLVVRVSLGLSAVYNLVGVAIAAAGLLSPAVCAVLMPLSSVTVVAFACAGARRAGHRLGWTRDESAAAT